MAYFASPNGLAFEALGLTAVPSLGEARGDGTAEALEDRGKSSILRRISGPPAPERDISRQHGKSTATAVPGDS